MAAGTMSAAAEWPALGELGSGDAQVVFHTIMDAFSRPGTVHRLPAGLTPVAAVLPLLALTDLMAPVAALPERAGDPDDATIEAAAVVARLTGADLVAPDRARFALALAEPDDWSTLNRGSDWSPETGATLVQRVDAVSAGGGPGAWRLTGPGIDPSVTRAVRVDGASRAWVAQRDALTADYPRGVDCLLVADSGDLVAIPRTTRIEVA